MTAINLIQFKGELPQVDPKKLPLGNAVTALNCHLSSGSLEPVKGLGAAIHTFPAAAFETLTRHPYRSAATNWLQFSTDVDLVRGPIANDKWDRVYWTDGVYPKIQTSEQSATSSLRLGIPAPASAPVIGASSGVAEEGAIEVDCAYICTYVSKFGEEGPPSVASAITQKLDGMTVQLTSLPGNPSGEYDIDRIRLYRSESGATFNYLSDVLIGVSTFDDSAKSDTLLAPMVTEDWIAPDDSMVGLTYMGNGILAGFFGNTLCFSEPYYPHAWPVGYQLAFKDNIVGIGMSASGLVVTTTAEPWVIMGSHPNAMAQQMLDSPYACVSKRSMVDMGSYVLYASNDGLVAAAGGDAKLVSANVIDSDDFKALNPSTWKAFRFNDRYFVVHDTGCLSFSPSEGLKHFTIAAKAAFFDLEESELYLLLSDKTVCKWGDGSELSATWRSGIFTLPPRVPMACARVDADGPCTLNVYFDGALLMAHAVGDDNMFRLPAGRFRELEVEIVASSTVHSVSLASSPEELR